MVLSMWGGEIGFGVHPCEEGFVVVCLALGERFGAVARISDGA